MNVFCASGGGTKGAFHGGVFESLIQNGIAIDAIAGVSTGALISGWMSQASAGNLQQQAFYINKYKNIWFGLKSTNDIRSGNLFTSILRIITKKPSLYTLAPLYNLIDANLSQDVKIQTPVRIGIVDLQSSQFISYQPTDRTTLINGMIASSAIPMIAPPVTIKQPDGTYIVGVDGGVRVVSPLDISIALGKQLAPLSDTINIFVSNATPVANFTPPTLSKTLYDDNLPIWAVAERTIWIQGYQIILDNISVAVELNKILNFYKESNLPLPAWLQDKRVINIYLINSTYDPYDTWEVVPSKIQEFWKHGITRCQEIIQLNGLTK